MESEVSQLAHPVVAELLSFPRCDYCFNFMCRARWAVDPDRFMGNAKGIQ